MSVPAPTMVLMSDAPGLSERRPPARRRDTKVGDFTLVVRVPGNPSAIRVFTADEAADAVEYAKTTGGAVENLEQ